MRVLSVLTTIALAACQPFAPVDPSSYDYASGQCLLHAHDRCGGLYDCERQQARSCLAELGWVRTPEGWVRVRTAADLAAEIDRAARSHGAADRP